MICTKRSFDSQCRFSTMWLYIIVICATGPPTLMKPNSRKYRNTSRHNGSVTSCSFILSKFVTVVTIRSMLQKRQRSTNQEWILLIHQLPPKPTNLRVRIWRKLQKLGAVAIKNSVYVL